MKVSTTAERLAKIMKARRLRQTDLLEMCDPYCTKYNVRIAKSDLSHYLSGRYEPNQYRLTILGLALGVSEVWLMGYDVPMEREDDLPEGRAEQNRTEDDVRLLDLFHACRVCYNKIRPRGLLTPI